VTVTCQTCGKAFDVQPSRLKWGRGKSCSPACQHAAVRSKLSRKVTKTCMGCGIEYQRPPSHADHGRGKGTYCSRVCRDRYRVGNLHPQYIGVRPDPARGPNWQAQRRRAKARDQGTCQHCGAVGTDVHHIRPFRLFNDYRVANRMDNLITLCAPCHRRADAAFQAAEAAA
jgi:hypothetical protein